MSNPTFFTLLGFVHEKTLFHNNALLPHLRRRINDDLSSLPPPYRILQHMLKAPGALSGYTFYTQFGTEGGKWTNMVRGCHVIFGYSSFRLVPSVYRILIAIIVSKFDNYITDRMALLTAYYVMRRKLFCFVSGKKS